MTLHAAMLILLIGVVALAVIGWAGVAVSTWRADAYTGRHSGRREWAPPAPAPADTVVQPRVDAADHERRRDWGTDNPTDTLPRHRVSPAVAAHYARREAGEL